MKPLLLLLLSLVPCAWAHPQIQHRIYLGPEPGVLRVAVQVSLKEVLVVQDGAVEAEVMRDSAKLDAAIRHHADYVQSHLTFSTADQPLSGHFTKLQTPPERSADPEQTCYLYEYEYALSDPLPVQITLRQDMLKEFSYAPGQSWDVSYVVLIKTGDGVHSGLLLANTPTDFPTGWALSGWQTFRAHLVHGILHILTGYDHLLFVSALLLAAVRFRQLFAVVLVFTLAHTLTLILSVLEIVRLPSSIVEPFIAGSIVYVAVENFFAPARTSGWQRLLVAFGFGLMHGLGFAGGLMDAMRELPGLTKGVAITAFSLGVELGHLTLIIPAYALLALGRKKLGPHFQTRTLRWGSAAIACAGLYYLVAALPGGGGE